MTDDNRIAKVEILIQQKKYDEAEKLLKSLLTLETNNIHFLALLANVKLQQDNAEEALEIINNAIGLSPDIPYLFYVKSQIALQQEQYDEAEKNIRQAIELNPLIADYFAFHANIKLIRKKYQEALELSDKALELDAENLFGLNTRSKALLKLNKKEQSFQTIEGALREDPNNPYTHANYGWGLLEKGEHKKALEHFKEALQNDPSMQYAKAGMLNALKAKNPVFRLFLKYAFFMSNLTAKYQWGVIIGFYLGVKVIRIIAASNEALQPYLTPIIVALALIAFSTWIINPVSNLFLRFNKYGKFLLDKKEKMSSNFVGASFLFFLAGILLYFIMSDAKFLTIAAFGFAMMLPFGSMFSPSKYKNSLLIYTLIMALVGIGSIGLTFLTDVIFNTFTVIFLIGFIAFQWITNFLMIKRDNR